MKPIIIFSVLFFTVAQIANGQVEIVGNFYGIGGYKSDLNDTNREFKRYGHSYSQFVIDYTLGLNYIANNKFEYALNFGYISQKSATETTISYNSPTSGKNVYNSQSEFYRLNFLIGKRIDIKKIFFTFQAGIPVTLQGYKKDVSESIGYDSSGVITYSQKSEEFNPYTISFGLIFIPGINYSISKHLSTGVSLNISYSCLTNSGTSRYIQSKLDPATGVYEQTETLSTGSHYYFSSYFTPTLQLRYSFKK